MKYFDSDGPEMSWSRTYEEVHLCLAHGVWLSKNWSHFLASFFQRFLSIVCTKHHFLKNVNLKLINLSFLVQPCIFISILMVVSATKHFLLYRQLKVPLILYQDEFLDSSSRPLPVQTGRRVTHCSLITRLILWTSIIVMKTLDACIQASDYHRRLVSN